MLPASGRAETWVEDSINPEPVKCLHALSGGWVTIFAQINNSSLSPEKRAHRGAAVSKPGNQVTLLGSLQRVEGALDLLKVRTFMASQPIRVGQQRLLERLSRPDECIRTHPVLGW